MVCQTSIAHEFIDEHVLAFLHTVSNQIHKIPVMKSAEQEYLRKS